MSAADPTSDSSGVPVPRLVFPARQRIGHAREFQAVFAAKAKKSDGPLLVFTLPNGLGYHRLGLSIGRRVGGAVRRGLLKRHLREAFRLVQHELPMLGGGAGGGAPGAAGAGPEGYDIIVGAQAHTPLTLERYREVLAGLVQQSHRVWEKRARQGGAGRAGAGGGAGDV